ncbi:hypothetical protein D1872_234270 [compost metagenome]
MRSRFWIASAVNCAKSACVICPAVCGLISRIDEPDTLSSSLTGPSPFQAAISCTLA